MNMDFLLLLLVTALVIAVVVLYTKLRKLTDKREGHELIPTARAIQVNGDGTSPSKKEVSVSPLVDATTIEISSPNLGEKLIFTKTALKTFQADSLFVEVSNNGENVLSGISGVATPIAAVSRLNPKGLFTATVDPDFLTKFTDLNNRGNFSTMIHGEKGIITHAGFKEVSANVFRPMALFQIAAFVTGQYYLHGIANQLKSIDAKIDALMAYHHNTELGKILHAREVLTVLYQKKHPALDDITQLRVLANEIGSIKHQYLANLNHDLSAGKNLDVSAWTYEGKMDKLVDKINGSHLAFHCELLCLAEETGHLLVLMELLLKTKMVANKSGGEGLEQQVFELLDTIAKWDKEQLMVNQAKEIIEAYFAPVLQKARGIANPTLKSLIPRSWSDLKPILNPFETLPGFDVFSDVPKKYRLLLRKKKEILEQIVNVKNNSQVWDIRDNLIEQKKHPIELVYSVDENMHVGRLFVKQDAIGTNNHRGKTKSSARRHK